MFITISLGKLIAYIWVAFMLLFIIFGNKGGKHDN